MTSFYYAYKTVIDGVSFSHDDLYGSEYTKDRDDSFCRSLAAVSLVTSDLFDPDLYVFLDVTKTFCPTGFAIASCEAVDFRPLPEFDGFQVYEV